MEFNATFIITIISFVLFAFIMNSILYEPIRKIVEKRKEYYDANNDTILKNKNEGNSILEDKAKKISGAKEDSKSSITKFQNQAKDKKEQYTNTKKEEMNKKITDSENQLNKEKEDLKDEINNKSEEISNLIFEKITQGGLSE